jgi:hypothetical protein
MAVAHVFDFDDTLSHSDAMIHAHPFFDGQPVEMHRMPGLQSVRHSRLEYLPDSLRYSLSSREFADLAKAIDSHGIRAVEHGDEVGHGHAVSLDFNDIIQVDSETAKPIQSNMVHLERAASQGHDVWILTGRKSGGESDISDFIKKHGGVSLPLDRVVCVGSWGGSTHKNKAKAFLTRIIPSGGYDEFHFYDDDTRNLDEVKEAVSPFGKVYVINSITGEVSSEVKDRVAKARERRTAGSDLRRVRKLSGIV